MAQLLNDLLGAEAVTRFDNPGPVAIGLPPGAYTREDFFPLEKAKLFRNTWAFVGFAHELSPPGDAVPLTDHCTVNESSRLGSAVDISRESGEPVNEDTLSVSSRYLFSAAYPVDWRQRAGVTHAPGIDPDDMPASG